MHAPMTNDHGTAAPTRLDRRRLRPRDAGVERARPPTSRRARLSRLHLPICLLADAGNAWWFLALTAAGAPIFLLVLRWLGKRSSGAAAVLATADCLVFPLLPWPELPDPGPGFRDGEPRHQHGRAVQQYRGARNRVDSAARAVRTPFSRPHRDLRGGPDPSVNPPAAAGGITAAFATRPGSNDRSGIREPDHKSVRRARTLDPRLSVVVPRGTIVVGQGGSRVRRGRRRRRDTQASLASSRAASEPRASASCTVGDGRPHDRTD